MDVNSGEDVFQMHHDIGPMFVLENIICILTLPESSATGCFVFVRLPYLPRVSILETQTTSVWVLDCICRLGMFSGQIFWIHPPSKSWQIKVYRDSLLNFYSVILVAMIASWGPRVDPRHSPNGFGQCFVLCTDGLSWITSGSSNGMNHSEYRSKGNGETNGILLKIALQYRDMVFVPTCNLTNIYIYIDI